MISSSEENGTGALFMRAYKAIDISADPIPITSASASAWAKPLPLANLVAAPPTTTSAQLSWSPGYMGSSGGGNNAIVTAADSSGNTQTYIVNSLAGPYTVTGLSAGANYTFTVSSAVTTPSGDPNNPQPTVITQSDPSNSVPVQTLPAVTISNPSVIVPLNGQVTLTLTVTGGFTTIDPIGFDCPIVSVEVTNYTLIDGGGEIVTALVTGNVGGEAPITATDDTGASATGLAIVTVPVPVNPVIYVYDATVAVGDTTEMSIYVINGYDGLPLEGETLSFALGNDNIGAQWVNATTDQYGYAFLNVTGINPGNTLVTITDDTHYGTGYGSVHVSAPMLQSLTASSGANTATANAGGSANLDVVADGNGNATLNIGALYTPADAGKDIPWSISGCDATPSSGTFASPPPAITLSGITAAASFTLSAGTYATRIATIQGDAKPYAPTVSVVAGSENAFAAWGDSPEIPGQFTFSRGGDAASSLDVSYLIGGTATARADYSGLTGTVSFPAGQNSVTVLIHPTSGGQLKGEQSVTVTVAPGPAINGTPAYYAAGDGPATVTIAPGLGITVAPDLTVLFDYHDWEITVGGNANATVMFQVARNRPGALQWNDIPPLSDDGLSYHGRANII